MAISKKDLNKYQSEITNLTKNLTNNRALEFKRKSITIDEITLSKIDRFRSEKGLDFSSSVRFIINDYLKS